MTITVHHIKASWIAAVASSVVLLASARSTSVIDGIVRFGRSAAIDVVNATWRWRGLAGGKGPACPPEYAEW